MGFRFTNRTGGVSTGAFSSLNLALHVGDDPALVRENREILGSQVGLHQYMEQVHGNRTVIIEAVYSAIHGFFIIKNTILVIIDGKSRNCCTFHI